VNESLHEHKGSSESQILDGKESILRDELISKEKHLDIALVELHQARQIIKQYDKKYGENTSQFLLS